ncbi:MAG: recombinase family protein [Clostridiales bacterium]|nr:recombinase family protein [Clostridiales bacterium]
MARKSRKNMPAGTVELSGNLTAQAVMDLGQDVKPYRAAVYARLSFESEANKERDTVETQIAYIRNFIDGQDDMVEAGVYADVSVTGTTFDRPEFDRMMQDIRAGKINTIITRDLSRLGRNYVEAGNYIERVFPFLDVRYIAITDGFDSAMQGADLSVPLKNIVNEYYSKDISKKVKTGKVAIWKQGGFSEGTPPYGYMRADDGSRRLVIDTDVSGNVVRIFHMFLDGMGYAQIARQMQEEGILSPPKYRFTKKGDTANADKSRDWHPSHVKEILTGEYYIGNAVHGKQSKCLATGRKNIHTAQDQWVRVEGVHEPLIEKEVFEKVQQRVESVRKKTLKRINSRPDLPKSPENKLVGKVFCAECGSHMHLKRHCRQTSRFQYECGRREKKKVHDRIDRRKKLSVEETEQAVFEVIHKHMALCIDTMQLVQDLNHRKENMLQFEAYRKEIGRLMKEEKRINANKGGLYEDYRDGLITAEELCQYQKEYENQIRDIQEQIAELFRRQRFYEKNFHLDLDWEQVVQKYSRRRKLTKEMVDAFVEKIYFHSDGNLEIHLKYDDFMEQLTGIAEERMCGTDAGSAGTLHEAVR